MFPTLSLLATLLVVGLEVVSAAAVSNFKRQTEFTLYAYNQNINGLPIFYGDGIAYIGNVIPTGVSQGVNITFAPATADPTSWSVSPDTTTWSSKLVLYINPTSGQFDSVGFHNTTDKSLPSGAVTTGFTFYGGTVMYKSSSGIFEAKFWAKPTNQTGLWTLKWNSDGTAQRDSLPVVVKSTPPPTISRLTN